MKKDKQEIEALHEFISSLDEQHMFALTWSLAHWAVVEVGHDVLTRKDDDGKVTDLIWDSCGDSLIWGEE